MVKESGASPSTYSCRYSWIAEADASPRKAAAAAALAFCRRARASPVATPKGGHPSEGEL
eukprot:6499423-Prymnesium_polylepis.1